MSTSDWRQPAAVDQVVVPAGSRSTGRVRKSETRKSRIKQATPVVRDMAPFAAIELKARSMAMWPVHPTLSLQPAPEPRPPALSGLRTERRYAIPAPDFVHEPVVASERAVHPEEARELQSPRVNPAFPASELTLLGWDPRAAARALTGRRPQEER